MEDMRPTKPCQKFEGHTGFVMGVIHLPGRQQTLVTVRSEYGTCRLDNRLRGLSTNETPWWDQLRHGRKTYRHLRGWRSECIALVARWNQSLPNVCENTRFDNMHARQLVGVKGGDTNERHTRDFNIAFVIAANRRYQVRVFNAAERALLFRLFQFTASLWSG